MSLRIKRFAALVLIMCLTLLIYSSCMGRRSFIRSLSLADLSDFSQTSDGRHYSHSDGDMVFSDGNLSLYFNENTAAVNVRDSYAGVFWRALPEFINNNAAVLEITLFCGNKRFVLNSQDNSAAFGFFSSEKTDDGILLSYTLSDKRETALKSSDALVNGDVYVKIPLRLTLADGNLKADIDMAEVFAAEGVIIEKIALLPFFGALSYENDAAQEIQSDFSSENAQNDDIAEYVNSIVSDYILLPDGCGGVMYTKLDDDDTSELAFSVYGAFSDENTAPVGAFGMKNDEAAFVAVITQAEERAVIRAFRDDKRDDKANIVFAEFVLTASAESGGRLLFAETYTGKISITYSFLSESAADYIGMAAAAREILIRNGVLSADTVDEEDTPVNISVIGSADGSTSAALSSFEQAENLLSMLKARGIENVNLLLEGFFTGGINQKKATGVRLYGESGGEAALESLCGYAQKQGFDVFAGVNVISAAASPFVSTAKKLDGEKLQWESENILYPYVGKSSYTRSLLSAGSIEKNIVSFMNYTKAMNFSGYALLDVADKLNADFSSAQGDVSLMSALVRENAAAFSTLKKLMLKGCNFNVIKNAEILSDVPLYTGVSETVAYSAVPFVPSILHSSFIYSGEAVNLAEIPLLRLLKFVEYGAVPYYKWVFSEVSPYYYELSLTEALDFFERAAEDLSDLLSARITAHGIIETGVYFTEYDDASLVYVNYNNYSVTIGDISVMPYDYIRLN